MIIACCPVDTSALPETGVPLPEPSVEHSITTCDDCAQSVWIGPAQRLQRIGRGLPVLCYLCALKAVEPGPDMLILGLDATADSKPRRAAGGRKR